MTLDRRLVAAAIGWLFAASPVAAQDHGPTDGQGAAWFELTTAEGCIVYEYFRVQWFRNNPRRPSWRGPACTPGKPVEGRGTVTFTFTKPDPLDSLAGYAGEMTGTWMRGVLNGPVTGLNLDEQEYSFEARMGCHATEPDGCTPDGGYQYFSSLRTANTPAAAATPVVQAAPVGASYADADLPQTFLHPETGEPCIAQTTVPRTSDGHYYTHRLRFSNICARRFTVKAETIPDVGGSVRTDSDTLNAVGVAPPGATVWCIENVTGSGQLSSCKGGYSGWWIEAGQEKTERFEPSEPTAQQ